MILLTLNIALVLVHVSYTVIVVPLEYVVFVLVVIDISLAVHCTLLYTNEPVQRVTGTLLACELHQKSRRKAF